jgi:serine/threonine-protein kinase
MTDETVGSYKILKPIGAGGMGFVYLAEHVLIGRKAAIKLLHPELSSNQEMVGRFFNEARSTALIKHPGIVEIFDFGYHPSGAARSPRASAALRARSSTRRW